MAGPCEWAIRDGFQTPLPDQYNADSAALRLTPSLTTIKPDNRSEWQQQQESRCGRCIDTSPRETTSWTPSQRSTIESRRRICPLPSSTWSTSERGSKRRGERSAARLAAEAVERAVFAAR